MKGLGMNRWQVFVILALVIVSPSAALAQYDGGSYDGYSIGEKDGTPMVVELVSFTATAVDGERVIILEWVTASEINNAGFHIRRSDRADTGFVRMTDDLIPASGSATSGATYTIKDSDVIHGRTYFYMLEDVDLGGRSSFHGPVSATADGTVGPVRPRSNELETFSPPTGSHPE